MKPRSGAALAHLAPAPEGWRAETAGGACSGASVAEVCDKIPASLGVTLLLPSSAVVTERFLLPQAPREDLLAMAQLQLEKVLPYAAEDFVFDLEELSTSEEGVQLLAVTVPMSELKSCAAPLRTAGRGPSSVGVYAVQLARQLAKRVAAGGVAAAVWKEGGNAFLLIALDGKLAWLDGLSLEGGTLEGSEISRSLLGADLAGALTGPVQVVCVESHELVPAVREAFPDALLDETPIKPDEQISGNWMPVAWVAEEAAKAGKSRLISRLQWAATGYAALLAAGFGWLAFEKSRISKMDQAIAELQPRVELSNQRQSKWRALEAALDPSRYLVEVLHQAAKAAGAADIRITEFQMNTREFAFSGEAVNVAEAIEYVGRLRKEPELGGFKIDSPNPNILPNERAQFRVTGRVETGKAKR